MSLLLVSPRDVGEALAAFRGGADIIDVKNPKEGSLGANFPWVISEIRQAIPPHVPLSAAIGDFPDLPGTAALAAFGAVNAGADIIKVGLKGTRSAESALFLLKQVVRAVKKSRESAKIVACAYGDFQRAGTIDPAILPKMAFEAGADVAMVDTAIKDGVPLTKFMRRKELRDLIDGAHSLGLWAAVAGSLGADEISTMKELNPDVIGIRGAVCEGGREKGKISEELVRRIKSILVV